MTKRGTITAHPPSKLLAPAQYQKPEALCIYLNFSRAALKARPRGNCAGTDKAQLMAPQHICIGINHTGNLFSLTVQQLWHALSPTSFRKTLCVWPIVVHTTAVLFMMIAVSVSEAGAAHPLAPNETPRMWPGRAGRVSPQTRGLPRSPLTTRWRRAVTRRSTTGTGPCRPSAPGEARLQEKVWKKLKTSYETTWPMPTPVNLEHGSNVQNEHRTNYC